MDEELYHLMVPRMLDEPPKFLFWDFDVAIVFLGSRRTDYSGFRYELPDNVVHFEEHFLHEQAHWHPQPAARRGDAQGQALVQRLLDAFDQGPAAPRAMEAFREVAQQMMPGGSVQLGDFLYGTEIPQLPGRFALHASALTLHHPMTGDWLSLTSPLPASLATLLD